MTYQLFSRLIFRKNSLFVACCFTLLAWLFSGLVVAGLAAPPQNTGMTARSAQNQLSAKFVQQIEDDYEWGSIEPHIVKNAFGTDMAIWEAFDGVRYRIWSKQRLLNSQWGITSPVESNSGNAFAPRIAFDTQGNALAVWQQEDDFSSHIWTNKYVPGRGWGVATRMTASSTGNAIEPQIVSDAKGNAMAVWQQMGGSHENNAKNVSVASTSRIMANRYDANSGWGLPVLIERKNIFAKSPQLAGDANGNMTVVWHTYDGKRTNIRANHYEVGSGWGKPVDIESNKTGLAYNPRIEMINQGYAQVTWQQIVGARNHVWANLFKTGTGWGKAKRIETNSTSEVDATQIAKNIEKPTFSEKVFK
jgi:hypothetical protein